MRERKEKVNHQNVLKGPEAETAENWKETARNLDYVSGYRTISSLRGFGFQNTKMVLSASIRSEGGHTNYEMAFWQTKFIREVKENDAQSNCCFIRQKDQKLLKLKTEKYHYQIDKR